LHTILWLYVFKTLPNIYGFQVKRLILTIKKFIMTKLILAIFFILFFHHSFACNIAVTATCSNICLGKKDTLQVSGATTYTWMPGSSNASTYTVQPSVTTTYTVYASGAGACLDTAYITVVVDTLPTVINVVAQTIPVCQGNSPVLTASGAVTYLWQPGSGTTNPYNPLPNSNTIYTVTGVSAQGCTKTKTFLATVTPAPKPILLDSFAIATFGTPFNNCNNISGSPIYSVTVSAPANATITSYSLNWGNGGGTLTGLTAASFPLNYTYPSFGVYNLVFTAYYANGCSRDTVIPVVNQTNPAIGISNVSGNTSGCGPIGYWFQMSNYQANATGTYYVWNFGDGTPSVTWTSVTTDSIFHLFTTSSCGYPNNEFTVSITAINSCSFTKATVSSIKVFKKPDANFSSSANNGCVNSPIVFTNTSVLSQNAPNCNTNSNWNWNFGDGSPAVTTQSTSHTYTTAGTYTVTLIGTGGCGADTIKVPVCVEENIVNFTSSLNNLCSPAVGTFTNTSPTATNCTTNPYTWSVTKLSNTCASDSAQQFAFINGTNATSAVPQIRFNNQGVYRVRLTHTNGCGTVIKDTTFTINRKPNATVTSLTQICDGALFNPTANVTNCGVSAITYLWSCSAATPASSSSASPSFLLPVGTHTFSLVATNECGSVTVSKSIIVNALPILSMVVAPNDTVCASTSVVLTPSGANAYTWAGSPLSGTGFSKMFVPTVSNTYTITGTNNAGCSSSITQLIVVNPKPTILVTNTIPSCLPGNDATVTMTATNGTPIYTYAINGGAPSTNNIFPNLGVGTYTCLVVDANSCSNSTVKNITTPNAPIINTIVKTNISCNGANNGAITISANGGTGALQFNLMPGNVTNATGIFNALTPNTYTINVTDANGCSTVTNVSITQPNVLLWNAPVISNVLCNGASTGSISASATGGTTSYNFLLSPSAQNNFTGNFVNRPAGNYTITLTDAKGCIITTSLTITEPPAITWSNVASVNLLCNAVMNGSVTALATGGFGSFAYQLLPLATTNTSGVFNNLSASNYTIKATDGNACSKTSIVNITQPAAIYISNVIADNPSCTPGNDGGISFNATGGTGVLSFALNTNPSQGAANFLNLASSIYTIYAIDANGCSAFSTVTLVTPNAPIINSAFKTNNNCFGQNIGTINVSASGGSSSLQYVLNPGSVSNSTGSFSGLAANNYTVSVIDNNGCNVQTIIAVTQPNVLSWAIASATPASCFGSLDGGINTQAAGGTPVYSYNLMPGNFTNTSGNFLNKPAGSYTISLTDGKGCALSTILIISQAPTLNWNTVSYTNATCFNAATASITASTIGGNGVINYTTTPITATVTNGLFTGLLANVYTLTATDGNGCTKSSVVTITQPTAVTIASFTKTAPSCVPGGDGSISFAANGGTPSYTYYLNSINQSNGNFANLPSGIYTISIADANGCSSNSIINNSTPNSPVIDSLIVQHILCNNQNNGTLHLYASGGNSALVYKILPNNVTNTSGLFTSLNANSYTISATDNIGCKVQTSVTVTNPAPINYLSMTTTPITCNGLSNASVVAVGSGGTGAYTFSIFPTAGAPNSNGVFANLFAATYTLHLQDVNGCAVDSVFVVNQVAPVSGSYIIQQNVTCFNGSNAAINVFANSGNAPFQYFLLGSAQVNSTGVFTNLSAGNYTVQIVDSNFCMASIGPIVITQPNAISFNPIASIQINCYGGTTSALNVVATGGTGLFVYSIPQLGLVANGTGSFDTLSAGTYTVLATDAKGCSKTVVANITQGSPILFSNINLQNPKCKGDKNGSIQCTAIGGSAPLAYQINAVGFGSFANFTGLGAGTYTIQIKDALGCIKDSVFTLIELDQVKIDTLATTNVICENAKDGTIYLHTNGTNLFYGLLPDSISNASGFFPNLAAGTYTVFVKNNSGCSANAVVTIDTAYNPLRLATTQQDLDCVGNGYDAWGQANPIGGAQPYTYQWSTNPIQYTQRAEGLTYGYYVVNVTDFKNCKLADTVYIKPGDCCAEIFFPNAFTPNGDGRNDGFIPISNAGRDLIVFGIYNRFGQEVWHANTIYDAWQGKELNGVNLEAGTYYYIYSYTCLFDKKKYSNKGDVILFR
jgi:large repetitive protein